MNAAEFRADYEERLANPNKAIIFEARGEPCGQPRPRFVRGHVFSIAKGSTAALWRDTVAKACKEVLAHDWPEWRAMGDPAHVKMRFYFRHDDPDMADTDHAQKPDVDNLAKLVLDVMQAERLINDDMTVASLTVHKIWSRNSGVTVRMEPSTPIRPSATHLDTEGLGSGGKPGWLQ